MDERLSSLTEDDLAAFRNSQRAVKRKRARRRENWLERCIRDDRGRVVANLANVMIALRADQSTEGAFAFDRMAQAKLLKRSLPVAPNGKQEAEGPFPRHMCDEDVSQLQEWLQHCGLPRIGRETVHQAVDQRARELSFHPLRQWLDGLVWDGTDRLSIWLELYFGAAGDAEYLRAIGSMFLISMVARIYEPGCKCDYMPVLEGDQGLEKSKACKALATEPYFSDALPDIHHKDAKQHLRGKWLIEVSELAAFTRAETETLKAFLTRASEKFRPAYGREDVIEPRQCVFVGTTNKESYLKDETGGRRFWPVRIGHIDVAGIVRDRSQLFAEAVDRYRQGEQWWPDTAFERQYIKPEQERRYEADPWDEDIADFVKNRDRVTVSEIARQALHFDAIARVGTADQRRIAGVLASRGWKPGRDYKGRFYARADGEEGMTHVSP
jgi:predicted P-loop ATPase